MPKLIVDRSGRRKVPPCGRLIEYREPHSPFQKLIDSERKRCRLSVRELARKIGVSQSTLWIWLHNLNGYPHPKAFGPEHVQRLSQILKIPEINIGTALDASRHLFSPRENPMPHETFDAFGRFIEILENDKRKMMSKSYVLNIAKGLFRGAKVTLLMLAVCLFAAISRADDLVTISGKRYEKVRVTEITPATIGFTHATGAARLPFSELTPDEQKKYGYDPAKAQAWLNQIAEEQRQSAAAEKERKAKAALRSAEVQVEVERMRRALTAVYDGATHRWYSSQEEAAAAREAALKAALSAKHDSRP